MTTQQQDKQLQPGQPPPPPSQIIATTKKRATVTMSNNFLHQNFHHYDIQSVLTEFNDSEIINVISRKNNSDDSSNGSGGGNSGNTGASAATKSSLTNPLELLHFNDLICNCDNFVGEGNDNSTAEEEIVAASVTDGECRVVLLENNNSNEEKEEEEEELLLDNWNKGCNFYRKFFYGRDHENWSSIDPHYGPISISISKESTNTSTSSIPHYYYRIIFRSPELSTLRGCISEDAIIITKKANENKIYSREIIECLFPLVDVSGLRLGTASTTPQILLKLDEQSLTFKHKIGVLYCKAGQTTEEEFYNNEFGSDAFDEFLNILGDRVKLKGFSGYGGGLDLRDESTGEISVFSEFRDYQIMFHVSTLLPFTPNNRQQLMRKRHIGNDIVTIVFQEEGSLPFSPHVIRSQFQHVFLVVRRVGNGSGYRIALSRSSEVPPFGPPLIQNYYSITNKKELREWILSKIINGENATYRSEKFTTMATRTRKEYLKELFNNHSQSNNGIDSLRSRFSMMLKIASSSSSSSSKKNRSSSALSITNETENKIPGGISYKITSGFAVISDKHFCIINNKNNNNSCIKITDLIAYSIDNSGGGKEEGAETLTLHLYSKGSLQMKKIQIIQSPILSRIITRIKKINPNFIQTEKYYFVKNYLNFGFHIASDGLIVDVDGGGVAGTSGLKKFSRLISLNEIPLSKLPHSKAIELLKNSREIEIVVIPPDIESLTASRPMPRPTMPMIKSPPPAASAKNNSSNNSTSSPKNYQSAGRSLDHYFSPAGLIITNNDHQNNYYGTSCSSGYGTGSSSGSSSKKMNSSNYGNYYSSKGGRGGGALSVAITASSSSTPPPPPLPARRRRSNSIISRSTDNIFLNKNLQRHSYYDQHCSFNNYSLLQQQQQQQQQHRINSSSSNVSRDDLNTRVAALKSAYLINSPAVKKNSSSSREVINSKSGGNNFERDLMKLIQGVETEESPSSSSSRLQQQKQQQQLITTPSRVHQQQHHNHHQRILTNTPPPSRRSVNLQLLNTSPQKQQPQQGSNAFDNYAAVIAASSPLYSTSHNHHHHHHTTTTPPPPKPLTTTDSTNIIYSNNSSSSISPIYNNHHQSIAIATPATPLETRVALLEARLALEQESKSELTSTVEKLKKENEKLLLHYEANKSDVQKLKALLLNI